MNMFVQPEFMERCVFEAARRDSSLGWAYQRQFAKCHDAGSSAARDEAFRRLHKEWFEELGLQGRIHGCAVAFEHIRREVARLVVAQAPFKNQSAELYGSRGNFTIALAVSPSSLLDEPAFRYWAMHEFLHIDDMLNPAFAYDRSSRPAGGAIARRDLLRDRFIVLWAISVDARLEARGVLPADARLRRRAEFERVFAAAAVGRSPDIFDRVWNRMGHEPLTHAGLMRWSREGIPDVLELREGHAAEADFSPGAACALCGFPSFDWADMATARSLASSIAVDFPAWSEAQAICGRCAEIYRSRCGVGRGPSVVAGSAS